MNKEQFSIQTMILLTMIILMMFFSSACNESGGGSSSGGTVNTAPVEQKSCESTLQRAWRNDSSNLIYEFHSTCKGYIPSCGTEFDYNIDEIDYSGGTISLNVTQSDGGTGCPVQGDQAICTFDYDVVGGQRQGMYVRCNSGSVVYYENRYGTP
jgi:hypothetical protein